MKIFFIIIINCISRCVFSCNENRDGKMRKSFRRLLLLMMLTREEEDFRNRPQYCLVCIVSYLSQLNLI